MNQVPQLTCRLPRIRKRTTRCYELAYEGCQLGRDWTLVHGIANGAPSRGRIDHAWLELDDWVYDAVLDKAMPHSVYISMFKAQATRKYSFEEAAIQVVKSGHYGPWSEVMPELEGAAKRGRSVAPVNVN